MQPGATLAASEDKTVRVWDASGRQVGVLRPPIGDASLGAVCAVVIHLTAARLLQRATWLRWQPPFALYLFDRATGRMRKAGTLSGLESPVHQLACLPTDSTWQSGYAVAG